MLLNNGVSMEIVSQWLGHSSTLITEQVYGKYTDSTIIQNKGGTATYPQCLITSLVSTAFELDILLFHTDLILQYD